ncbi:MAG: GNAT family N-acetyltransferase [Pseudomonadota bacterium]
MITTSRLVLRPLETADADWIAREISNPNVQQWLTSPPHPYRLSDAEDFLHSFAQRPSHRAILFAGAPVGMVTLTGEGTPDLGYWLGEAAWGKGVMTEAAGALLDWHDTSGGGEVESGWIRGNSGSEGVLCKLGFEGDGTARQYSAFYDREVEVRRVRRRARVGEDRV